MLSVVWRLSATRSQYPHYIHIEILNQPQYTVSNISMLFFLTSLRWNLTWNHHKHPTPLVCQCQCLGLKQCVSIATRVPDKQLKKMRPSNSGRVKMMAKKSTHSLVTRFHQNVRAQQSFYHLRLTFPSNFHRMLQSKTDLDFSFLHCYFAVASFPMDWNHSWKMTHIFAHICSWK